jgi:hypothetical protein
VFIFLQTIRHLMPRLYRRALGTGTGEGAVMAVISRLEIFQCSDDDAGHARHHGSKLDDHAL